MREELPTGRNLSPEAVAGDFAWLQETPLGDGALSFRLLVPKAWRRDQVDGHGTGLDSQRMLPLAVLASPQSDAYLQVQAIRLDREIEAEHWLRHYLHVAQYRLRTAVTLSPLFADSLALFAIEGQRFLGRFAARIHGDVLFLISVFCVEARYEALAEAFGVPVASFKPAGQPRRATVEERVAHRLGTALSFEAPASWQARPVSAPPIGKMAVDLLAAVAGVPVGMIRVKSVEAGFAAGLEEQTRTAVEEFAEAGVRVGDRRDGSALDLSASRFSEGGLSIHGGTSSEGQAMELWILAMRDPSRFVTVSLLTPDRDAQFPIWAENRRAFDIVMESLR